MSVKYSMQGSKAPPQWSDPPPAAPLWIPLATLLQGQSIPAVLSLQLWLQGLFTRESGECCVAVEWGYPWQDWAGLALALVLVLLLRPTPPARLRSSPSRSR
ncbi:hypothetical protein [Planotetraspora sp. GP83]|uniref:hypothetical protein n=1 Tax=Planotetraspora sp. GP83 TaxID=3156264 RepID=UPI003516DF7B